MANQGLINFIKEARKRGFDDYEIRAPLLKQGWSVLDVEEAFFSLKSTKKQAHISFKNKVVIYLDNDLLKILEKRAKKNLLTLPEQIEDILRRSSLNIKAKSSTKQDNIDDLLLKIFSRRKKK